MALAAEVAIWWALLTGLWLITLSSLSTAEEVVAAGCSLVAAVAATAARRAMQGAWRAQSRWTRWVLLLAAAVPTDTARVLVLAAHQLRHPADVHGRVERLAARSPEPASVAAARRALGTFVVGATPATVVIDWGRDELVVHRLVGGSASLEEAVVR